MQNRSEAIHGAQSGSAINAARPGNLDAVIEE